MVSPKFYYRKYYYNLKRKKEGLGAKGVKENDLDNLVLELAEQITLSDEVAEWSKKYLHEIRDIEVEDIKTQTETRNNYLKKLEERKQRAKEAYLDKVFNREEYEEEKARLEQEELSFKAQPQKVDWYSIATNLVGYAEKIKTVWEHGDIRHKRDILLEIKSNFVWNEEKLTIYNVNSINTLITGLSEGKEEINKIEQVKTLVKQGDLLEMRQSFPTLCGWGESNSRPLVGSQIFYH